MMLTPKSQHTGAEAGLLLWEQLMSNSKILSTPAPPHPKKKKEKKRSEHNNRWHKLWRVVKILMLTKGILCFAFGQPRKTEFCFISEKWEMAMPGVCNPSQERILLKASPSWKSPRMPLVEQREWFVPERIYSRWKKVVPWAREQSDI